MATDTVRKFTDPQGTSPAELKSAPLISRKMLLFMVAMVLANTGGSMYGPLLPLYLKSLNASVVQIGLFFTLSQIIPLALQILGGWISDSLGRLRSIAMGSVAGVFSYLGLILAPTWQWVLVGEGLSSVTRLPVADQQGCARKDARNRIWISANQPGRSLVTRSLDRCPAVGKGQPAIYFYADRLGRFISHHPGIFQIQAA